MLFLYDKPMAYSPIFTLMSVGVIEAFLSTQSKQTYRALVVCVEMLT